MKTKVTGAASYHLHCRYCGGFFKDADSLSKHMKLEHQAGGLAAAARENRRKHKEVSR